MIPRVCVCVFVCPRANLWKCTSDLRPIFCTCHLLPWLSPALAAEWYLSTSGFTDDVIFPRKERLLDVAAQLKRGAHAALGLAIICAL